MLTINALTAATSVLVPIQCEYYALEGLSQLIHTIELVKDRLNKRLKIEGVVFTMYDARTNFFAGCRECKRKPGSEYIQNDYSEKCTTCRGSKLWKTDHNCTTQDLQEQKVIVFWQKKLSAGRANNGCKKNRRPWKRSGCTDPNKAGGTSKETVKRTRSTGKKEKTEAQEKPAAERLVKISSVEPNLNQPRRHFDEDALMELSESIKQYGVLQPLLVSDKKDYFEIIAGERRWRAAKMAGLKEVPVVVKEFTDQEIVEISLIENIQREDLNPIEEAMAYKRLMEEFHLKQDEIADRVAKSRTAVTNSMRLLKLTSKVQEMVIADMISAGHARALLGISDETLQENTAMKVFDEKLSVRETEKLVKNLVSPAKKEKTERNTAEDAIYESLEEKMKGIMGTKVSIQRKKNNKGKIEIEYYSRDELERIIDLFESIR